MRQSRPRKRIRGRFWLCAVMAGMIVTSVVTGNRINPAGKPAPEDYERPPAEVVHRELQDILQDPQYAPQRNFWQWLIAHLSDWDLPLGFALPAVAQILVWVLLIWCSLTLLAITAHLLWVFIQWLRNVAGPRRPRGFETGPAPDSSMNYEELRRLQEKLAADGNYRRATAVMLRALLLLLDSAGAVRFHPSKTNREYAREFDPDVPGEKLFQQFVRAFDSLVYGPEGCDRTDYSQMCQNFEQVKSRVRQHP